MHLSWLPTGSPGCLHSKAQTQLAWACRQIHYRIYLADLSKCKFARRTCKCKPLLGHLWPRDNRCFAPQLNTWAALLKHNTAINKHSIRSFRHAVHWHPDLSPPECLWHLWNPSDCQQLWATQVWHPGVQKRSWSMTKWGWCHPATSQESSPVKKNVCQDFPAHNILYFFMEPCSIVALSEGNCMPHYMSLPGGHSPDPHRTPWQALVAWARQDASRCCRRTQASHG